MPSDPIQEARNTLQTHIEGLQATTETLSDNLPPIVDILATAEKAVLTGIGKSWHIGSKIAATFTSLGTPAIALHAAEGRHGDLGLIRPADAILALSFSGESQEIIDLLPHLRETGAPLIAITQSAESHLGRAADHVLTVPIQREACPFNLAPTTSALVTLALGDLLATLTARARGFTRDDYARLHPAGAIGHSLIPLADVMRTGERLATVPPETIIRDALRAVTTRRGGAVAILDSERRVLGIITDGDVRRALATADPAINILDHAVTSIMTPDPITLTTRQTVADAWDIFTRHPVEDLLVLDHETGALAGIIDLQDLPKLKGFHA